MTARAFLRFDAILLALALVACGGGDGSGRLPVVNDGGAPEPDASASPDAGPPVERGFLELCSQPELYCERLYECATPDRLAEDQLFFGHEDEPSCVEAQSAYTGVICGALASSLEAGRMSVDLVRLAACSDYMEALSCESFVHDPPEAHAPCEGSPFLTPLVGSGDACAIDVECREPGSLCTAAPGSLGVCVEAPAEGEPCLADRCAEGLICDDGTCVAPAPGACHYDWDCGEDEWCDQPGNDFRQEALDPTLTGVCALRLSLGEACEDVQACVEGLHCDDTAGFDPEGYRLPGHCAEPLPEGAACNEPADCQSFECDPFDGVCL